MAEKLDWMARIRACIEAKGGSSEDPVRSSKDSLRSSKDSESNVITRSTYDGPVSKLCGTKNCSSDLRQFVQALVGVTLLNTNIHC